jgi:hypothetical protein
MHTIKGYLQHIQKVMVDLFILLIIFCIPLELLCLITHAGRCILVIATGGVLQ